MAFLDKAKDKVKKIEKKAEEVITDEHEGPDPEEELKKELESLDEKEIEGKKEMEKLEDDRL